MDPFVQQLASLCRVQVTRCKWVFVPTHAVGRTIGERIALGGTNWLNLRFVTPLDIALRMGAPFLVERGIEPSEQGLGPALMMRLLLDLPEKGGYFRPLADQPTMAQALWATVRELRMAGVKSADLKSEAFESPAKHAELRALLSAYEQFLATNNRGDMAVVYEEAVKHPDWCPIQPEDCWTELPDMVWTPLQRALVDAMPGEHIVPRALEIPGAALPRRLDARCADLAVLPGEHGSPARSAGPSGLPRRGEHGRADHLRRGFGGREALRYNDRVPSDPAANPLAFLMQPGAATATQPIALFHAGGREAEIEEVFRRILARGASLDQVEIACASDAHVALVWEKALRHEWAVTLGPGIAAPSTRPGRALIALCDWIETDFAAGHLRRLLQSGDLGIEAEDEGFTASQAARTLGRAEAGWGRATYDLSLGLLRKSYETRANDPDLSDDEREAAGEKAALTAKIAAWIAKLIASIPEPRANPEASAFLQANPVASAFLQTDPVASAFLETDPVASAFRRKETDSAAAPIGRKVPLQQVVDAALTFLEHSTSRVSQLDHRAATALSDYVVELRALGPFTCSLQEALRFIRERVESLSVAAERPRPGHLYACRLQQAGYSGRPHLFVVGLEEGRVFPAASEDPVLLDAERSGISPALRQSTDRIDEAVWSVLSRLSTHALPLGTPNPDPRSSILGPRNSTSVTVSYSTRDTREFRETYASWLMLQAFRLQQGNATASYQEMKAALGEPVSSVPLKREAAATESAWWLRTVVSTGDKGIEAVESSFAPLARGREAAAERDSERFTGFDGYVPDAGKILDPCAAGNAFSVTELEGAAGCPYRFFLKRGLGLRALDEGERDKDVWLDPSTKGSELHAIYATVLRRCRDAGRRPDIGKDGAWLTELAQGALDRLNREMPPATAEILARESADFLADVELFLEGECEPSSSEPIGFEVSFGRPLGEEEEALARAEPVEIDLGGGLTFRIAGRIDRIDKVGPSDFQVLDYKTGGFWRDDWHGTFKGGRRLQHALYGLAVVELLRGKYKKPKVTGAVYYFPSHKGRGERREIAAPTPAQTEAVLADLREVIVKGAFVHAPDKDACKWCDYDGVCGADALGQAAGKLEDSKLKAFGRLAAHV